MVVKPTSESGRVRHRGSGADLELAEHLPPRELIAVAIEHERTDTTEGVSQKRR